MIRRFFFYAFFLSIPCFLGISAWQTSRYGDLERELGMLEKTQEEWVENNKRLIALITLYSSPDRIEYIAREELGLQKKRPEEVLQITIRNASAGTASAFTSMAPAAEAAAEAPPTAAEESIEISADVLALIQQLLHGAPDE